MSENNNVNNILPSTYNYFAIIIAVLYDLPISFYSFLFLRVQLVFIYSGENQDLPLTAVRFDIILLFFKSICSINSSYLIQNNLLLDYAAPKCTTQSAL